MENLINRFLAHWKTTAGGLLSVAGVIVSALNTNNPKLSWVPVATAVIAGLTGLLAKDN